MSRLFLRLLRDIISVMGSRWLLYLGLMVMTGLMEAVSLASVVPLLGALGVGTSGPQVGGRLGGIAVIVLQRLGVTPSSLAIGVVVVAALMLSTSLFLLQAYVGARLQTTYVYRWQQRLARSIFGARWGYFLQRRQGELVNALVTETQRLGSAFYQMGLLLTGIIHSILFLTIAAALSGPTTAVVMAGAAILFLVTRPLVRRSYAHGTGISHEDAALQSLAGELVSGAKLVKATATESQAVGLLRDSANRLRQHLLANAFDVQIIKGVFEFGAAVMGAVILVVSQSLLNTDAAVTIVILAIFVRLMPKLTSVQHGLQALSFTLPALEVVHAFAQDAAEQAEAQSPALLPERLRHGPLSVRLSDVAVQYGAVEALSGVSLEIASGTCVALVGGSGAGKSTLVDAVLGLVPVSSGTISINDELLDDLPLAALRRRIGYMGQETVLYNATIRDNVLWGNQEADDRALQAAAQVAGAAGFIQKMSKGYDTTVGDRGALLAGGERQRLGLTRAVLGKPGLLILDEATSALDAETERAVTDAVATLKRTTTVLMIAHRLSSVRIADTICVMEEGRVVEHGSWQELMSRGGRFQQLWRLQHAEERGHHVEA
ncbi:MAG TPA: ABC transporter ATP-binding protein [Vicinamibacterales bacterium]|jgi:ATP-binding cassette subfamily C protein